MNLIKLIKDEYSDTSQEEEKHIQTNKKLPPNQENIKNMFLYWLTKTEYNYGKNNKAVSQFRPRYEFLIANNLITANRRSGGRYDSEDLHAFSFQLAEFQEREWFCESGIFLSALINFHSTLFEKQKYTLETGYLTKKLQFLGFAQKTGTITIQGDTGRDASREKTGGELFILGNTGPYFGVDSQGGISTAYNAEYNPGFRLQGGTLKIKSTKGQVCAHAEKGIVHIEERIEEIQIKCTSKYVQIYSENKLMYPR